MPAPLPAPPDVLTLAPAFPAAITLDVVEAREFDDDNVMVRRVQADLGPDRFGADAFYVPGWKAMSADDHIACALSLVLSLGDELCERHLRTDSTELTMTLDDVGEAEASAMRRFAVSAALPTPLALLGGSEPASNDEGDDKGDDVTTAGEQEDHAGEGLGYNIYSLFGEIEVSHGVALVIYARVPADEAAHDRAIAFLASR